jgi:predicted homoserine dehydrogenase-like protein
VPLSAVAAVMHGESHMRPLPVPTAEVGCVAKRDLAPGERLDAIGGYCYRGFALTRADAVARSALPIGLAQGATVMRRVAKGELLTNAAVEPDPQLAIVEVRRLHDARIARLTGG